jgi:hypothetical protein
MRPRFTLRAMFVLIFAVAACLWFVKSPVPINRKVASRIKPGMTDGVTSMTSSYRPTRKGADRHWVGFEGEIVVEGHETVDYAKFYPGEIRGWSPVPFLWQRYTRMRYSGWGLNARVISFLCATAFATIAFGLIWIPVRRENSVALHGVCGLIIGGVVSIAFFSQGWFWDLAETACMLSSPVAGAVLGIGVGSARRLLAKPADTEIVYTSPLKIDASRASC